MPLDDEARRRAAATKRERTQQRLLDAAQRVLARDGDVSHRAVAEASGISEASVYRYFRTKEALVTATYERALPKPQSVTMPEDAVQAGLSLLLSAAPKHVSKAVRELVLHVLEVEHLDEAEVGTALVQELVASTWLDEA